MRQLLARALAAIAWLVAGSLTLLVALRFFGVDSDSTLLIALSTAWPLTVLTGLVVVLAAGVLRRASLGGAAVVMTLIIIWAWLPAWTGAAPEGSASGGRIRLLAVNLRYSSDTGAAASRQIRRADPDVVVISELSPLNKRRLDLRQYAYSWQRPQANAFGQAIFSRWPISSRELWWESGIAMMRATIASPGGAFRVYQVHTTAPARGSGPAVWKRQLGRLGTHLHTERLPVVAAGDFNASHWDEPFRRVLGGPNAMVDAGAGRGYLATWPSGRSLMPLVLPLDHVLISRGIGVRVYRVLGPIGSDHRAVVADLVLG